MARGNLTALFSSINPPPCTPGPNHELEFGGPGQPALKHFETIKNGEWVGEVERLHLLYGPIVRVGPKELHFSDPEAYNDIYAVGLKFKKDPETYLAARSFDEESNDSTIFLETFSRQFPRFAHPQPHEGQDSLRLGVHSATILRGSDCQVRLSGPGTHRIGTQFGFLTKNLPPIIVKILTSRTTRVSSREMDALKILADNAIQSSSSDYEGADANFFHTLLKGSGVRCPEHPRSWLAAEALNPVFFAIRGVPSNESIREQLVNELNNVWPDLASPAPGLDTLEKLPYLVGVT
ncbi:hypothetical protein L218DRAFT_941987 [Marasmius fiardii PR-910]|nr:hypothetical protein L218DRAFT_941987 [Marasmius fiardii PR-910]